MNIDLERKRITVAIRELAAAPAERVRGPSVPRLRIELGQDVHRAYRQQRQDEYGAERFTAEVALSLERELDGFTAHVRGRADGVVHGAAGGTGLLVEEVKSVALDAPALAALTAADVPGYALQARFYALCLALRLRGRPVHARLVLISIVDESTRTIELDFDAGQTAAELDALLRAALVEAEAARARARRRIESAAALVFPYDAPRPPQQALLDAFDEGLAAGRPVLAEAPTGTGKTAAALLAGLRHSLASDSTLYFTTAKSTQGEHVARTFTDLVRAAGLSPGAIRAVTLRAKDRMCPPGTLQCHPARCPYLRDYEQRAAQSGIVATLAAESCHLDADTVYERAARSVLCPFEVSRDLADAADLVICDYNHVYDRAAALPPFIERAGEPLETGAPTSGAAPASAPAAPAAAVVVIDEAHNLLDRARAYDSPCVRSAEVARVRERVLAGAYLAPAADAPATLALPRTPASEYLLAEIEDFCETLAAHIDSAYEDAVRAGRGSVDDTTPVADSDTARDGGEDDRLPGAVPARFLDTWQALGARAEALLFNFSVRCRLAALVFPRDPLIELLRGVMHVRALVAARDRALIPYVAGPAAPTGSAVGVCCVDPSRRLAAMHRRTRGVLAMSATLSPLEYYRALLGLDALDARTVRVPSPFLAEHRCVMVVPTVTTQLRERERHAPTIARLIGDIVRARPGRYAAYFPSFEFLSRVRALLDLPSERLLVQLPDMPLALRQRMLARLREKPGPGLLLAVTGGVFAEGIDLPGEDLIGALIVGVSLPAPSFERALMRQYFDEHTEGQGFAHAMLYPAMQRVVQAAGRVLRTPEDRGVIALLDHRFAEPGYVECLPRDWYRYDPGELVTEDPAGQVAAFWARAGAPGSSNQES
ncbi:MAG: ATP-dependent DNA helicase [Polyangia bacterium]